jgi:hypothetical protein
MLCSDLVPPGLKQQDFFFANPDAVSQEVTRDLMSPFVTVLKDISTHNPRMYVVLK